jgi:hypothetical protein
MPYLTDLSPRCTDLPDDVGIVLMPHQKASIARCMSLERETINVSQLFDLPGELDTLEPLASRIRPRVGIIADISGSGKSFVALSVVLFSKLHGQPPVDDGVSVPFAVKNTDVVLDSPIPASVPTSVIVVPHTLVAQWGAYAASFRHHLSHRVVSRYSDICELSSMDNVRAIDLIIVTNTFYSKLAMMFDQLGVKVVRTFVDESDTIPIPVHSGIAIRSEFNWFITSNSDALLTGSYAGSSVVNATFGVDAAMGRITPRGLVVRCEDAFALRSFSVVEPDVYNIVCKYPRVDGGDETPVNLSDRILSSLQAGDVTETTIRLLPASQVERDEISALRRLVCGGGVTAVPDEQIRVIERVVQRISALEISADVDDANACTVQQCNICFEDVSPSKRPQVLVPCCANTFCLRCVCRWVSTAGSRDGPPSRPPVRGGRGGATAANVAQSSASTTTCPMCRSPLCMDDVLVVSPHSASSADSEGATGSSAPPALPPPGVLLSKMNSFDLLVREISRDDSSRILIYANHKYAFDGISESLRRIGVSFRYLRGNNNVVRGSLEAFRKGDARVLLTSPYHHGSGLNIQAATDIIFMIPAVHMMPCWHMETRIMGLALRVDRTEPLRVWNLCYEMDIADTTDILLQQRVRTLGEVPEIIM